MCITEHHLFVLQLKPAMLLKGELPRVGPAHCIVVGGSLRVCKERVNNSETLLGWCRSSKRDECALGALASYLVWYNDMSGVSIINTMYQDLICLRQYGKDNYNPQWRKLYLVWGDNAFTPVSYTTHNSDITQLFNEGDT